MISTRKTKFNVFLSKKKHGSLEMFEFAQFKSCHFNRNQTKQRFEEWGGNALKITMFYKKIDGN
jgi:hypothetical protein